MDGSEEGPVNQNERAPLGALESPGPRGSLAPLCFGFKDSDKQTLLTASLLICPLQQFRALI